VLQAPLHQTMSDPLQFPESFASPPAGGLLRRNEHERTPSPQVQVHKVRFKSTATVRQRVSTLSSCCYIPY
jgi:hypothetical protein